MNSTVLWYTSQATGIVSLVMFTLVMLLGVTVAGHGRLPGLTRFSVVALHRSISLLSMVFLAVHIVTAVLDTYVDISAISTVVPFASSYEPLWIGLGAVAVDLMIALVISSLLRAKINPKVWRAIHRLAYACWPVAIVHTIGLGAGSGSLISGWGLWLTISCVLAVAAGVAWRVAVELGRRRRSTPAQVLHNTTTRIGAGV